jgi:hypothetical protein
MFIILHFTIIIKKKENIPQFSQLSIFIGLKYLVAIHKGNLKPLVEKFRMCDMKSIVV